MSYESFENQPGRGNQDRQYSNNFGEPDYQSSQSYSRQNQGSEYTRGSQGSTSARNYGTPSARSNRPRIMEQDPIIQNRFDKSMSGVVLLLAVIFSVAFYLAMFLLNGLGGGATGFAEKFIDRGWTPYAAVILTCWALSILVVKFSITRNRRSHISETFFPKNSILDTETAIRSAITATSTKAKKIQDQILGRRMIRALNHFLKSWSVRETGEILQEESDADYAELEFSYSLVRTFLWTIPILGFIGTVIGVGTAVGGFADFLSAGESDLGQIKAALENVTSSLGVAFDTTLVALALSIVVMIAMSTVERNEKGLLQAYEEYCRVRLLHLLPAGGKGGLAGRSTEEAMITYIQDLPNHMAHAVSGALRQNVPGVEFWKEEANRLALQLTTHLSKSWQEATRDWTDHFSNYKEDVLTFNADLEKRQLDLQKYMENIHTQFAQIVPEMRQMLNDEQANVAHILEKEQQVIQATLDTQKEEVNKYAIALLQSSNALKTLVAKQVELENGLLKEQGSPKLTMLIEEMQKTLQELNPALDKLVNEPLPVKVQFQAG